jgi:hypothetical protein
MDRIHMRKAILPAMFKDTGQGTFTGMANVADVLDLVAKNSKPKSGWRNPIS